jgi:hypothetical protein
MTDILASAQTYWLNWFYGAIAMAVAFGFNSLRKKLKEQDVRQRAVELGIQALLRDNIVVAYYRYTERGCITLHGLESVEKMYKEYHNLGGNGTITKLVEDMKKLEVKDN